MALGAFIKPGKELFLLSIGWASAIKSGKSESEAELAPAACAHAEMLEAGGVAPSRGWDHIEEGTGIAINSKERLVLLLAGGGRVYKSYDYEAVRGWGQSEGPAGAGLFVSVVDREMAEWRVSMKDRAERARWMEILSREIHEGAAQARRGQCGADGNWDKNKFDI